MAGLYLHIPFCSQRCSYCDFYFVTTAMSQDRFLKALVYEIQHYGREFGSKEALETIYFGGGTPSLLPAGSVRILMDTIHESFDTSDLQETTFELNPENGTPAYLDGLLRAGITRLSVGIQSFFDRDLEQMNRVHDSGQAREVLRHVNGAGFDSYSMDLIFGLPDQPSEYWAANLEIAASFDVPHISTYSLTLEEGTPLWKQVQRGQVQPQDDAAHADAFEFTMDYLMKRGYEHYEISSFARDGHRSRHNHRYWDHTNYIGCGPSAHSFWWTGLPARRWANVRNLKRYEALLSQHVPPLEEREHLSLDALADEYILLRLRTADGLDLSELERRYGVDLLSEKVSELAELEQSGLIHPLRNHTVRLTNPGKTLCDSITSRLLPA